MNIEQELAEFVVNTRRRDLINTASKLRILADKLEKFAWSSRDDTTMKAYNMVAAGIGWKLEQELSEFKE